MPVKFSIHSNIHDYQVSFEEHSGFIDELANHPFSCFIVDENVWKIYSGSLLKHLPSDNVIILPINEDRKSLDTVQELYDHLVKLPSKRNLTLITFGGGILQDITGFVASTLYRGIKWIFVPTTLLAQADSCIGSKTSLNFRGYKNLIGTFFPPSQVHIYPPFLQSQLDSDYYSGYGEVIKLHLMGGASLFQDLLALSPALLWKDAKVLEKAIRQSLEVKMDYMSGDEFDLGRRNLLNYGHDFGHALENTSHFDIPHGQAVIFGMLAANIVAKNRGLLDDALAMEIAGKTLIPGLKVRPSLESITVEKMITAMKKDKKRTGDLLALIMMQTDFSFIRVSDLSTSEVANALDESRDLLDL